MTDQMADQMKPFDLSITDDTPVDQICMTGLLLLAIASCKRGETMPESIDAFRELRGSIWSSIENLIRVKWDSLRNARFEK